MKKKKQLKLYYISVADGVTPGISCKGFVHHKKRKQAIAHFMNMMGCDESSVGVGSRIKPTEPGILQVPPEVVAKHGKELERLLEKAMQPS